MDKAKVGIIGSKFAANFTMDSLVRSRAAEVTAVASPNNADEFAKKWNIPASFTDYGEMIEKADLDIVSICAPNFLHYEVGMAAAKAGKHIICEKPLATKLEHGREMVRAAGENGVKSCTRRTGASPPRW